MRRSVIVVAAVAVIALLGFAVWSMAAGERPDTCPKTNTSCCPQERADCPANATCTVKDPANCPQGKECCPEKPCADGAATCNKDAKACAAKPAGTSAACPVSGTGCATVTAAAKDTQTVRCPVMGGVVKDISKAPKSTYQGKTYYFCCEPCKPKFDKDPAKYIKPARG